SQSIVRPWLALRCTPRCSTLAPHAALDTGPAFCLDNNTMKQQFPAPLSRRSFLAASAAIPAVLGSQVAASVSAAESTQASKRVPIGLELYSVRNELSRDLPNTLKTVAKMGYEVVEFYSPYFKWTPVYAKGVRA